MAYEPPSLNHEEETAKDSSSDSSSESDSEEDEDSDIDLDEDTDNCTLVSRFDLLSVIALRSCQDNAEAKARSEEAENSINVCLESETTACGSVLVSPGGDVQRDSQPSGNPPSGRSRGGDKKSRIPVLSPASSPLPFPVEAGGTAATTSTAPATHSSTLKHPRTKIPTRIKRQDASLRSAHVTHHPDSTVLHRTPRPAKFLGGRPRLNLRGKAGQTERSAVRGRPRNPTEATHYRRQTSRGGMVRKQLINRSEGRTRRLINNRNIGEQNSNESETCSAVTVSNLHKRVEKSEGKTEDSDYLLDEGKTEGTDFVVEGDEKVQTEGEGAEEEGGGGGGTGSDSFIGAVDDTCLEECLKEAVQGVVQELPESWLLVRDNMGELLSSISSLVESLPRPSAAHTSALAALLAAHTPCHEEENATAYLTNAHLLLYVALKSCCLIGNTDSPRQDTLRLLQDIVHCEGSYDRLLLAMLLGERAPGQGCRWYYADPNDEDEKARDLQFVLDHIRLQPRVSFVSRSVSEVVSAPLWSCGSPPVVVAALANSPRLVLTLLQYGAGDTNLYHEHYSHCCTNGVYVAIIFLIRKLEGERRASKTPPVSPRSSQVPSTDLLTWARDSPTAACLRYLLRAVPRVPGKLLRDQVGGSDPPALLPRTASLDPPSLAHLSRAAAREFLRARDLLPQVIHTLNVPVGLQRYLNLQSD